MANGNLPEWIKEKYDNGIRGIGRKIRDSVVAVATSGFGKGVLIAAAVILGGFALSYGVAAATGALTLHYALGSTAAATVSQGIMAGLNAGLQFITNGTAAAHGMGLAILAGAGILGSVSDLMHRQNRLRAQTASLLAKQQEIDRALALQQQPQQEVTTPAPVPATAPAQTAPVQPTVLQPIIVQVPSQEPAKTVVVESKPQTPQPVIIEQKQAALQPLTVNTNTTVETNFCAREEQRRAADNNNCSLQR